MSETISKTELEQALKGFWFWVTQKGKHYQDPIQGVGKHSGESVDVWLMESLRDWARNRNPSHEYLVQILENALVNGASIESDSLVSNEEDVVELTNRLEWEGDEYRG